MSEHPRYSVSLTETHSSREAFDRDEKPKSAIVRLLTKVENDKDTGHTRYLEQSCYPVNPAVQELHTIAWTDQTHVGYTPSGYAWRWEARDIDQTEYEHYRAHVIRASARLRKQAAKLYERIERGAEAAGGAR